MNQGSPQSQGEQFGRQCDSSYREQFSELQHFHSFEKPFLNLKTSFAAIYV